MRLRAVTALCLILLAACAAPAKLRYYTLSGEAPPAENAASLASGYRVAIGPATVPEALDRPQIMLRVAPNRYAIADDERWSQALKREIPRVVAQAAARHLPAARVAADFQYGGQDADYQVLIDVLRFESAPGESATLDAAWSVRNRAGARLRETRSVFVERVTAPGVAPLVSAHAKALTALALEIAEAVKALAKQSR